MGLYYMSDVKEKLKTYLGCSFLVLSLLLQQRFDRKRLSPSGHECRKQSGRNAHVLTSLNYIIRLAKHWSPLNTLGLFCRHEHGF
jgi:hypothetical protein